MRNMYARLVIGQVKPDMMDSTVMKDVVKKWIEVNTAQKKMKGNKGAYLLVERAANKVISISMWETAADMKATESAHRERASKWDHVFYTGQPITEEYEIVAQV
jgi:heme-degrading monooxygenase HmoA